MSGRALLLRCLILWLALSGFAQAQTKLLRFPDIHGDRVVFTYGGDLWTASTGGGTATRLTAHPGLELFAKFSPDGQWLAFTGQYDGDEQVYVMPSTGGVPRQLTFYPASGPGAPRHGYDNQVMGWTPDGKAILFRSTRDANGVTSRGALYTVALEGGPARRLPMPDSGAGTYSPDGKQVAYSPMFRDFRHWKRYEGGWAQDLYLFDLASKVQKKLAYSPRTERDPMWIGEAVYFASDRDGTLNLYRVDPATDKVTQLTFNKTWDVRWPSSDRQSRIVYELNGELRIFDVKSGADAGLSIKVPSDGGASRPSHLAVGGFIEDFSLAPGGERALFVARGDVFTVPVEKGLTRNLTRSSNAHDKHARWSPDGKKVAFVSDLSGEDQVYVVDQGGLGRPEALTTTLAAFLYVPEWSGDGKRIAISDKDGKLYVISVADKKLVQVAQDTRERLSDYAWSPDGQYLAFSLSNPNGLRSLHIWGAAEGKVRRVTGALEHSVEPSWDPGGKYLYFLSERDYAPQISSLEWDYAGNRMTGVFALALRKDGPHPFGPESDEVGSGSEKKEEAPKADAKKAPEPVRIDFDGLGDRAVRVPIPADNISGLVATKGHLLYQKQGAFTYGRDSYQKTNLLIFELKKRQESELVADVHGWAVSGDGAKVLVRTGEGPTVSYAVLEAKPKTTERKVVATKDLYVDRVPAEEWRQIYDEVWRRYRDFFYVKNMHGYDWKALREQYRPWLQHVTHRSDLTYVLTELIAELNVGHAYVEGGDQVLPERPRVGLPGALFELDEKAGRYRLAKIFRGQNEEPKYRSPLTEVGVDARVGDYVLAIDGVELKAGDDPYRLLRFKTGPVALTLNALPSQEGARQVTYTPVASEAALRYLDFVLDRRERVDKLSNGRVGYLHVPDMGASGIYEFIKWYYPQIRKEGLVVDVRANGGGNVSAMLIERLGRKLLGTWWRYGAEEPSTYPDVVFHGHKACLISETSASDGDIFPFRFRKAGLGPLIGKRTWGGVVGINNTGPLMDGGIVYVPQFATADDDGKYVVEGHGVEPDIEVENDPKSVLEGHDLQLERGVQEILKRMAEQPMALPKRPADPVKTK